MKLVIVVAAFVALGFATLGGTAAAATASGSGSSSQQECHTDWIIHG